MEFWTDSSHPLASDAGPATKDRPTRTINAALSRAEPGDTVIVAPGIYRETVTPIKDGEIGKPISLKSLIPHAAIVRGSEVLESSPLKPGRHVIVLPPELIAARNPFALGLDGSRIGGTLGQVFMGDDMLREVTGAVTQPGTWAALDNGTKLEIHVPADRLPGPIEVSLRDRLFAPQDRGTGHITVEGFVFERCANQSAAAFWEAERRQCGAVGFRAGHHIRFVGNIVRHAKTIGIDAGIGGGAEREDGIIPHDNLIEDNVLCDNGEVGACGQRSHRTIVRNNIVERNSCLSLCTVEEAGLKFHEFMDGVIEGNIIRDNEAAGVWLDAVWTGARVSRNFVVNNVGSGIFIELGADKGTVDHNIVAYTRLGDGIYSHDANDVLIAHNLVFGNAHFGIYMRYVTDRPFPHADGVERPAGCARNRILNNLFIDNYRGHISLPANGPRSSNNQSNHNHFINGTQWQWEGLGFHRFCLGDNDGNLPRTVLNQQMEEAGVEPPAAGANAYLTMEEWQRLGFDLQSFAPPAFRITSENGAVVKGTTTLAARDSYFELRLSPEAVSPLVPAIPECPRDYFGNTRESTTAPGPFALLGQGSHCLDVNPRINEPQG